MLKAFVKKVLAGTGYKLQKINSNIAFISTTGSSMEEGLGRMKKLGIEPRLIVDIGAAQGTWTEKAINFWGDANFELIEPLLEQTSRLNELKSQYSNINYRLAVAGEFEGEVSLTVSEDLDGSGVYGDGKNTRSVPAVIVDDVAAKFNGDVLIKFDTHGYELPIIKGAVETLKRTCLLIVEVYGFRISPTCLLFHELTTHLDGLGFRLIDIVDIMRRPGDNAFWQADAFFIRKDHPVFDKNSYA